MPSQPPNPLLQPSCTLVYPNGLNSTPICTTSDPQSVCAAGTLFCTFGAGGYCANLQTDVSNCGGCSTACDLGASCTQGQCACPKGQVACNGSCADLATDGNNCGQCGQACGQGVCTGSTCDCNTSPSTAECGGSPACVDTSTDAAHCGGCDTACPFSGQVCADSTCGCPPVASSLCSQGSTSVCTDVGSDTNNCGGCGFACLNTYVCVGGACMCPPDSYLCGYYCCSNESPSCGSYGEACCAGGGCYDGSSCQGLNCG